jgi:cytochrome c-type biogenesis protein CcmH
MTLFWICAALLAAVAIGFLLVPLWRERQVSGNWSVSGLAAVIATVPLAVGLYFLVSSWDPNAEQLAPKAELDLIAQLAAKMVENPDDVRGWRLLGNSYMTLGQYRLARQAFLEAWQRTPEPDNALKLSLAESFIYTDSAALVGDAGDLVEEVLATEPNNQKALFWGGVVAGERGQHDIARTRFTRLLAFDLPDDIEALVRRQLAALGPGAGGPEVAALGPGSGGAQSAAAGDGPQLTISVRVAEGLSTDALGPSSALFLLARPPGTRQPIAVRREPVSAVPGTFTLSDANKMPIATQSLGDFDELSIVARLSVAGVAAEGAGDLFAETTYRAGDSQTLELVIDQVVP